MKNLIKGVFILTVLIFYSVFEVFSIDCASRDGPSGTGVRSKTVVEAEEREKKNSALSRPPSSFRAGICLLCLASR